MPSAAKRDALVRQWDMLQKIPRAKPGITASDICRYLKDLGYAVTKRTVERDLAMLAPVFSIECNDKSMPWGWYYRKGSSGALSALTVGDAISLRLIESILKPLMPATLLEVLDGRFEEARQHLKNVGSRGQKLKIADKFAYVPPALPVRPPLLRKPVLEAVHEALIHDQQLNVSYVKPNGQRQRRVLNPYALFQRGPVLYLGATDPDSTQLKLFAVHRMERAQVESSPVKPWRDFSIERVLADGLLQFSAGQPIKLRARITGHLFTTVNDTPLSADQRCVDEGAGWTLTATVNDSWQLHWWVLSQGADIEVLEPVELRRMIRDRLAAALAPYERTDHPA